MILIPTYYTDYEWQGTVILNGFDPSGNYIGQYVADVAMAVVPQRLGTHSTRIIITKAKAICCMAIQGSSWERLRIRRILDCYNH